MERIRRWYRQSLAAATEAATCFALGFRESLQPAALFRSASLCIPLYAASIVFGIRLGLRIGLLGQLKEQVRQRYPRLAPASGERISLWRAAGFRLAPWLGVSGSILVGLLAVVLGDEDPVAGDHLVVVLGHRPGFAADHRDPRGIGGGDAERGEARVGLDGRAQSDGHFDLLRKDEGIEIASAGPGCASGSVSQSVQIATSPRTPSLSMSRPRPCWTISPRAITRYWSASSAAKS